MRPTHPIWLVHYALYEGFFSETRIQPRESLFVTLCIQIIMDKLDVHRGGCFRPFFNPRKMGKMPFFNYSYCPVLVVLRGAFPFLRGSAFAVVGRPAPLLPRRLRGTRLPSLKVLLSRRFAPVLILLGT
jgi:hypothetical protein